MDRYSALALLVSPHLFFRLIGVSFLIPGAFGAAFYIPTAVVPPLLVTHGLIFFVLVQPKH
jgi:hypothetical protein